MSQFLSKRGRVAGVALFTGAAVVLAASGAAAAGTDSSTTPPASYQGTASSNALSLSLLKNIPGIGTLPLLGSISGDGPVSVGVLSSSSELRHDATGANPDLANADVKLLTGTLAKLVSASGGGDFVPASSSSLSNLGPNKGTGLLGLPDPLKLGGLLQLSLPNITATSTADPLSASSSADGLDLSAITLGDLLPVDAITPLKTGFETLLAQLDTVQTLLGTIGTAGTLIPGVGGVISGLNQTLDNIQAEAQAAFDQITTGSVADIQGLVSDHSLKVVDGKMVSTAHVELGKISLLGGFATVDGFNNTVTATAGGEPGSASFTPTITNGGLGALHIAGAMGGINGSGLVLDLGPLTDLLNGLTGVELGNGLDLLGGLVSTLTSNLDTLEGALNGLISINVDQAQNVKVADDGTSASGEISGFGVSINLPNLAGGLTALPSLSGLTGLLGQIPGLGDLITSLTGGGLGGLGGLLGNLPLAQANADVAKAANARKAAATTDPISLVDLEVGSASASAQALAATPETPETPTTPTTPTTTPNKPLAYTGAELPITGGIALVLVLAGAWAARRRRQAQV
ncbi:MAG TPA: hypothetical protein VHC41_07830 [Mycobacteriales bacterium]|nr:hypothetical protein [Mycobacteriales bacterium]